MSAQSPYLSLRLHGSGALLCSLFKSALPALGVPICRPGLVAPACFFVLEPHCLCCHNNLGRGGGGALPPGGAEPSKCLLGCRCGTPRGNHSLEWVGTLVCMHTALVSLARRRNAAAFGFLLGSADGDPQPLRGAMAVSVALLSEPACWPYHVQWLPRCRWLFAGPDGRCPCARMRWTPGRVLSELRNAT